MVKRKTKKRVVKRKKTISIRKFRTKVIGSAIGAGAVTSFIATPLIGIPVGATVGILVGEKILKVKTIKMRKKRK